MTLNDILKKLNILDNLPWPEQSILFTIPLGSIYWNRRGLKYVLHRKIWFNPPFLWKWLYQVGFPSFPVVDWFFFCLYTYEFWFSLWKIVRSSVILLLPSLIGQWTETWLYRSVNRRFRLKATFNWQLTVQRISSEIVKYFPSPSLKIIK